MTEQRLRQDLERLRAEVNRAAQHDSGARQKLNALINDIEHRIAEPRDAGTGDHVDLVSTVRHAIEHFETDHPRATAILNDIMVTLGNMGI